MSQESGIFAGGCHCGSVRFEVTIPGGLGSPRRCNCSMCRMKGAVMISTPVENFTLTGGEESLSAYRFNTGTAQHFFCSRCGIHTHHRTRTNPNLYGVNVACLDGVSPFDFAEMAVFDGMNHPADRAGGGAPAIVGTMRFEPAAE